MIRVDVSEIKEFRTCKRKWQFSSRNNMRLNSVITPDALRFGTLFHECLHMMYMDTEIDRIIEYVNANLTDPAELKVMTNMVLGYYDNVLFLDKAEYDVLEIEHGFNIEGIVQNVALCGSIDMIVEKKDDHTIWGFEHKSASRFKDALMIKLDEQPRMYTLELKRIVKDFNDNGHVCSLGGIVLNEVKKVQRKFEYQRTICKYEDKNEEQFLKGIRVTCGAIYENQKNMDMLPEPSVMKCQMCQYSQICETVQYGEVDAPKIIEDYKDVFIVRTADHLDAKAEKYHADSEGIEG